MRRFLIEKQFSLSYCLHQIGPLRNGRLQFKQIELHLNGDVDLYASVKHSVVLLNLAQWGSCDECILPGLVVYVALQASTQFAPQVVFDLNPQRFCGKHFIALLHVLDLMKNLRH